MLHIFCRKTTWSWAIRVLTFWSDNADVLDGRHPIQRVGEHLQALEGEGHPRCRDVGVADVSDGVDEQRRDEDVDSPDLECLYTVYLRGEQLGPEPRSLIS